MTPNQAMTALPLVSVVTPFHNTDAYLAECIESVLRQTCDNWEYVLVDNQSTDRSGEIADSYAARFPGRIRVIRTASLLSQVDNYNFALTCISPESKYCKVVQADDWIFPECLQRMVENAEAHPAVALVGAYELAGDSVQMDGLPYPSHEVTGRDVCRFYFLKKKYVFGTPTSLLIRSDRIRSRVPFYDAKFAPFEDAHVCFEILRDANFGFVHQVLTFSRRDNESMLSKVNAFNGLLLFRLRTIVAHGRDFLTEAEYREQLKDAEREYYRFLARRALRPRKFRREFWQFHRQGLAAMHRSLRWEKILRHVPEALARGAWSTLTAW